ncbi:response regulator transcription factor [Paenarthrobacter sp. DKR-5]|uniref:response regulator transcription factor n=1 Tax=Paenarthrobacter sp. DKR-5 TaxID=2835535 RepID=UPI001BDD028B|nr:response regulator transcription factor [Paenarthrobacter sp. DKR-5]MBT1001934.1 response regulator transcription factor [Paenarthrobacter sp. DKR-5]
MGPEKTAVVIEDDADVRELVMQVLSQAGFQCHAAGDGYEGLAAVRERSPLLVTLDVGLPGIDGFEVSRRLRTFSDAYVLMLSARTEEPDVVLGFATGADGYLTKPFRPRELRLRVDSLQRRPRTGARLSAAPGAGPSLAGPAGAGKAISHNGLELHPGTRSVTVRERAVELSRSEFDLLHAVLQGGRRVQSRAALLRALPGARPGRSAAGTGDERLVETHIGNLRRKLGDEPRCPQWIETVRGIGYRLAPEQSLNP